jgi:hypothetical protein
MAFRSIAGAALVAGCSLMAVGCSSGGLETVSGIVTLDGAPLADAKLTAIPQDPKAPGPFVARTDAAGAYSLGPIGDAGGGMPPGAYRLMITTAHSDTADETHPPPPERVPAPYPQGVDFTVPDGGKTDANFDLASKK